MKGFGRSAVLLGLIISASLSAATRTSLKSLTRALSAFRFPSSTSCHAPAALSNASIFRRPAAPVTSHKLLADPARFVSIAATASPKTKLTKDQIIEVFTKHCPGCMNSKTFGDFGEMLINNLASQELTALQLVTRINLTITRFLSGERRDFWTVDKRKVVLLELAADNAILQEELANVFKQTYPNNGLNSIASLPSFGVYDYTAPITATKLGYRIDDHCNFYSSVERRASLEDKEKFAYKLLQEARRLDLFPEVREVLRLLNIR